MCYTKEGVLKDRREMLRVKAKSLAEEARIIRREERRTQGELHWELVYHRRGVVRYEARATYLAYGLIRGTPIDRIEKPKEKRTEEFLKKVRVMVERYGPTDKDRRRDILALCV